MAGEPAPPGARAPRVLVVDADPATLGLLQEWLAADGCRVVDEAGGDGAAAGERFDLALVDVPYPREACAALERVAARSPGTPILALSCAFFSSVDCTGCVARTLRVAGVLPKPIRRETLIDTVHRLLNRTL